MAPGGEGTDEDREAWEALPQPVRWTGDNALSSWVKYTHKKRSFYQRVYSMETTLSRPPEGVKEEMKIGVNGRSTLVGIGLWEEEYAALGGPDCWAVEEQDAYQNALKVKKFRWGVLSAGIIIATFCSACVYVRCNGHGEWGFGSCNCIAPFTGEFCQWHLAGYKCLYDSCHWADYVKGTDWGYYTDVSADCESCAAACTQDADCGAVECGSRYCSWWARGICMPESANRHEFPNTIVFSYQVTCRQLGE